MNLHGEGDAAEALKLSLSLSPPPPCSSFFANEQQMQPHREPRHPRSNFV